MDDLELQKYIKLADEYLEERKKSKDLPVNSWPVYKDLTYNNVTFEELDDLYIDAQKLVLDCFTFYLQDCWRFYNKQTLQNFELQLGKIWNIIMPIAIGICIEGNNRFGWKQYMRQKIYESDIKLGWQPLQIAKRIKKQYKYLEQKT